METNKKLEILANEVFQMNVNELSPEMNLKNIETWDSMAALALISVFEEYFNKLDLDGLTIKKFNTIQDIIDHMN